MSTIADGSAGFLNNLFNFGAGVFYTHADRQSARAELEIARQQRAAAEAAAREAEAREAARPAMAAGIDQNTMLLIGGGLIAALVLMRL